MTKYAVQLIMLGNYAHLMLNLNNYVSFTQKGRGVQERGFSY